MCKLERWLQANKPYGQYELVDNAVLLYSIGYSTCQVLKTVLLKSVINSLFGTIYTVCTKTILVHVVAISALNEQP